MTPIQFSLLTFLLLGILFALIHLGWLIQTKISLVGWLIQTKISLVGWLIQTKISLDNNYPESARKAYLSALFFENMVHACLILWILLTVGSWAYLLYQTIALLPNT